jgi:hypothetical protein
MKTTGDDTQWEPAAGNKLPPLDDMEPAPCRLAVTSTPMPIIGVRCPAGASVAHRRRTKPAPAEIVTVAPATAIDDVTQIVKPTPAGVIDAMKQGLSDAAKPAPRNADGVALLIPEDLSIPEFLRREPKQPAAQVVKAAPISKPVPVRITNAITKQEPAGSPQEPISADGTSEAPKAAQERSTDGNVLTTAVAP